MGCGASQSHPCHDFINWPKITHEQVATHAMFHKKTIVVLKSDCQASRSSKLRNKSNHSVYVCCTSDTKTLHKLCMKQNVFVDPYFVRVKPGKSFIIGAMKLDAFHEGIHSTSCEQEFYDDIYVYQGHLKK